MTSGLRPATGLALFNIGRGCIADQWASGPPLSGDAQPARFFWGLRFGDMLPEVAFFSVMRIHHSIDRAK